MQPNTPPTDPTEIVVLTAEQFENILTQAADIHTIDMSTSPGRIIFTAEAGATPITWTVTNRGIEIIRHDLTVLNELSDFRRSHHQRYADLADAPVETLQELNLPLYWNREWLEEKHRETGSYSALAREYKREVQGAKASSIANYARKKFHLSPRDRLLDARDAAVNEWENVHETTTQTALAKKYEVTVSTINRWISDATRAYKELTDNPDAVKTKDEVAVFAARHNLLPRTINRWKRLGSKAYAGELEPQGKSSYKNRRSYAILRKQLWDRLDESPTGELPETDIKLAEEFGVDRSTIANWKKQYKKERSPYGTLPVN